MTTISAQSRAAQAGASAETSGAKRAKIDAPHTQTARFSAVYKNNVTFAHAHHSHHLAQATSARARQLAAALRKRQAAAHAAGKRFAPSQRAASNGHGAAKSAPAASAKTALRKPASDRVTRDGRQGGGGGGGQQEGGQQNGKQHDKDRNHSREQDHDGALDGVSATTGADGVSAVAPARANAARDGEIRAAISETLLKLRDGIAAGKVPSADRALQSLMQRIHVLRAAEGALAPTAPAAKRELLRAVSQRLAETGLGATHAATSSARPGTPAAHSTSRSNANIAGSVNLLAALVLLVLERPGTPGQTERGRHLNAALLGAIDARLRAAPRA